MDRLAIVTLATLCCAVAEAEVSCHLQQWPSVSMFFGIVIHPLVILLWHFGLMSLPAAPAHTSVSSSATRQKLKPRGLRVAW